MSDRMMRGKPVSDVQIEAWVNEAETGYDLDALRKPQRGRPHLGDGPGAATTVRLDAVTLAALMRRAEAEGIATRSEAIRAAVRDWAHIA